MNQTLRMRHAADNDGKVYLGTQHGITVANFSPGLSSNFINGQDCRSAIANHAKFAARILRTMSSFHPVSVEIILKQGQTHLISFARLATRSKPRPFLFPEA